MKAREPGERARAAAPASARRRPSLAAAPAAAAVLRRACACGRHTPGGAECEECRGKRLGAQRQAVRREAPAEAPPEVHAVLGSPGRPLEPALRAAMEPAFGRDFSGVRVHTGDAAARSALAVDALAYTVGQQIVFAAGELAPGTPRGARLLAHELAHTVQQQNAADPAAPLPIAPAGDAYEQEADAVAARVTARPAAVEPAPTGGGFQGALPGGGGRMARRALQREPPPDASAKAPGSATAPPGSASAPPAGSAAPPAAAAAGQKDQDAIAIINYARSQQATPQTGAVEVVKKMLNKYYPGDVAKVKDVAFDNQKAVGGLSTESIFDQTQQLYMGKLWVGQDFFDAIVDSKLGKFAHRVLQLGHEIEHIDQHRAGKVGPGKKDEREFLAFAHEGLAVEKPGTGTLWRPRRVAIIDQAIGYYFCLGANEQKSYQANEQQLEARRQVEMTEIKNPAKKFPQSEWPPDQPPTACQRQP
jgi:hypothetical protein